uniref:Protein RFT1 homolog n=1 Tax=Octactis speculum TaxID=3111310 RepID=A0A7S2D6Q6_9STRA|mmetsp:Transcript_44250/g.60449  ORF Transcript_44250/g.60449 Transcript_44250/m.60449 type:complete len:304 (+) Transcript_44250:29-940(+)
MASYTIRYKVMITSYEENNNRSGGGGGGDDDEIGVSSLKRKRKEWSWWPGVGDDLNLGDTYRELTPFVKASGATILRTLSLQLFLASTTAFLGHSSVVPEVDLAAHQVLKQLYIVLSFAMDAIAIAAQQMVASSLSDKATTSQAEAEARVTADRILLWGACAGCLFALALLFEGDAAVRLLTSSPDVREAATPLVGRVLAPLQVVSSLVFVGDGILQGSQDFKYEAVAMIAASLFAGGSLLLADQGMKPEDYSALNVIWASIALLQFFRLGAFVNRYFVNGPLCDNSEEGAPASYVSKEDDGT